MSSPGNTARDKVPVTTADQIPLLQAMVTCLLSPSHNVSRSCCVPYAQYISRKTWECDFPSETTKALPKRKAQHCVNVGAKEWASLDQQQVRQCWCSGSLCELKFFPEANVALTGFAQEAGIQTGNMLGNNVRAVPQRWRFVPTLDYNVNLS